MFVASYWSDLATTTVSNARRPPHAQTDTRTAASRRENDSLHNHDAFKLSNFQTRIRRRSTIPHCHPPASFTPCVQHASPSNQPHSRRRRPPRSNITTPPTIHPSIDQSMDGWIDTASTVSATATATATANETIEQQRHNVVVVRSFDCAFVRLCVRLFVWPLAGQTTPNVVHSPTAFYPLTDSYPLTCPLTDSNPANQPLIWVFY